jgi:hypothetical protein
VDVGYAGVFKQGKVDRKEEDNEENDEVVVEGVDSEAKLFRF